MLELAILGLLKERAMHGYELRKQLSQRLGFFWSVSFGSMYPTLKKLERRGVVEKFFPEQQQASRRKQVYRITPAGEEQFLDLLTEGSASSWEEEKFPLRLTFFRYLGPEARVRLLERRKAYLEDKLDEGRRSLGRANRGRADTYTLSLMRHGISTTEHDVAWLDTLIAAERGTPGNTPRDLSEGSPTQPHADASSDITGDSQPPVAGSSAAVPGAEPADERSLQTK